MYIETVRNRNSPPAILLREGWREGKKVRKRTLANLSHLPKNIIELIRRALKGEAFVAVSEAFEVIKSSLHGHVNACRTTMRRLRFDKLLASKPCRERNLQSDIGLPAKYETCSQEIGGNLRHGPDDQWRPSGNPLRRKSYR